MEALKRAEHIYRKQLTADPSDMATRISLIWCLFMQSLHQAGQEDALGAFVGASDDVQSGSACLNPAPRGHDERLADQTLTECLHQITTVLHLCADPQARRDVGRIHALVRMSGGNEAIARADEDAARLLAEMTHDLFEEEPRARPNLRRAGTSSRKQ